MGNIKYSALFLLVSAFAIVYTQNILLKWKSASKVSIDQLLPAGKKGYFTYYVARGSVRKNWLNGKFLIKNGGMLPTRHITVKEVFSSSTYEFMVLNEYGVATGVANLPLESGPIFVESENTQMTPMHLKCPHVLLD
ncbi:unnamed protein product [Orchesella dallaii]|uniref:Uncharacterized protein n=1 Tax=Orchesella dallaii TaxID=48710 RepID=A0ABP1PMG6_9HEXA